MYVDISKIIKERRSVRAFKKGEIPSDVIKKLVESAIWAPSSCNRQPWHFIIVKNDELKKEMAFSLGSKGARKIILSAPAVVVVCINMSRYWNLKGNIAPILDAGVAIQNILLTAHSLGIGTCTIAGHIDESIVKKSLNISGEYKIMGFIPMGYPKKMPPPPKRQEVYNYLSIDTFKMIRRTERYSDVCLKRAKISRSGGDVSGNYETPKEKVPLFEYAKEVISKNIEDEKDVLFTYSGMGYFLKSSPKNVQCLVSSKDEEWYIREYMGMENTLILIPSFEDLSSLLTKYDCVVSLFDIHFMDETETKKFFESVSRILHKNGKLILVFLNKKSFYGLNYRLANLFDVNLENVRPCGYEHPQEIDEIIKRIPKDFKITSIKTGLFIPSPNFGYLFDTMFHFPYRISKLLDILQKIPYSRRKGSVVFLTLEKAM